MNVPSISKVGSESIDTQPHTASQRECQYSKIPDLSSKLLLCTEEKT